MSRVIHTTAKPGMKVRYVIDAIDEEAEREALALNRFRKEIGKSIGNIGTPRHHTKGCRSR